MNKEKNTEHRILLFEQNGETVKLFKETLADLGYDVEPVEGSTEGMTVLEKNPPELVIADVEFPEVSGLDILEIIKKRNLQIPVLITGKTTGLPVIQAFREGAVDYLLKPLDSSDLKERFCAYIKKRDTMYKGDEAKIKELMKSIEHDNQEMNNLLKIDSSFTETSDSKAMLYRLTDLVAESMNCEAASIMLVNERDNTLEFVVATGEKKQRLETLSIPLGDGIAGWVALHGEAQIVNDTTEDTRFTGKVDKHSGFKTRQILAIPLRQDSNIIGVLEAINTKDNRILGDDDVRFLNAFGERVASVIETSRTIENHQNFYVQTTNILVNAVEKKDIFTEGHSWKVAELSHKISLAMNLSETEKTDLHYGSLLHDIGKLDMPSSLFTKRNLSQRELEYIRQHPVKSAKLIEPITFWKAAVPHILYHHESWDGSGYPFGRLGDSIPIGARIIHLGEAFSVMRASNTYKKQMSLKEAILEIMRCSGKQFDPEVVKVFIGVLQKETAHK
ncbi:HD domain-containing phosphohydrolase [Candidatus Latescibacterota bacterium]